MQEGSEVEGREGEWSAKRERDGEGEGKEERELEGEGKGEERERERKEKGGRKKLDCTFLIIVWYNM